MCAKDTGEECVQNGVENYSHYTEGHHTTGVLHWPLRCKALVWNGVIFFTTASLVQPSEAAMDKIVPLRIIAPRRYISLHRLATSHAPSG